MPGMPRVLNCPCCDYTTKKLTMFDAHLKDVHGVTSQQLWDKLNSGPVICKCGCGKQTSWINWNLGYSSMVNGHNGSIYAVRSEIDAFAISEKRRQKLIGKEGWAKGLTKENDERINARARATSEGRKRAFNEGKITAWNKGGTKDTDERIKKAAEEISNDFKSGKRVAWHKGKTEDTDERIKQKNDDLRTRYALGELIPWSKGKTAIDDDRIQKTWDNRDVMAEYSHIRWSNETITEKLSGNVNLKLQEIKDYKNCRSIAINVKCVKCDWTSDVTMYFALEDHCPACARTGSKAQHELTDWLESLGIVCGKNVSGIIGRQQLDIYIPSHKIAIEFNGLYWHSEKVGKNKHYHQKKSDMCRKIGISLFHVFEDEWKNKRQIVQSMIASRLMNNAAMCHEKDTNIIKLTIDERKKFFNENHIDGDTDASEAWGLGGAEGNILYAVSVRKSFHKSHAGALEIARYCHSIGHNVVGGFNKIIDVIKERVQGKIIAAVDTRFGDDGKEFIVAGFKVIDASEAKLWWTDFKERLNYVPRELIGYTGISKIWGCRSVIYELNADQSGLLII